MSDAAWGFFGSVIGSLMGGAIAWLVAVKTTRLQFRLHHEFEASCHV